MKPAVADAVGATVLIKPVITGFTQDVAARTRNIFHVAIRPVRPLMEKGHVLFLLDGVDASRGLQIVTSHPMVAARQVAEPAISHSIAVVGAGAPARFVGRE